MTSDHTLSNLNKIVELSESMLAIARDGDWEQVQVVEQQRQKLFKKTFPLNRDTIADPALLAQKIQKIADLDRETMTLMQDSRKELSGLANKISSGRQAVGAYRDVQGR
jgi:uncharacterized protein YoxC